MDAELKERLDTLEAMLKTLIQGNTAFQAIYFDELSNGDEKKMKQYAGRLQSIMQQMSEEMDKASSNK